MLPLYSYKKRCCCFTVFNLFLLMMVSIASQSQSKTHPDVESTQLDRGAITVKSFNLPMSDFLDDYSRKTLLEKYQPTQDEPHPCASVDRNRDINAFRDCENKHFYAIKIEEFLLLHKVKIEPKTMAGVYTEVFTPAGGVLPENRNKVLINLHGGGFMTGGRTAGRVESIPISSLGKIKVISVDYRMAPEYRFPAASEDVAAVYRELLKRYKPENIGMYGSSAGGLLTAGSMAWFQKEKIPKPGAIAMLFAAAHNVRKGDSVYVGTALNGMPPLSSVLYFEGVSDSNPLAFPGASESVLTGFPPSLLISATRDFQLSSVVASHAQLTKLGVAADLHVWDGLPHVFMYEPHLTESKEAFDVVVKFFRKYLQ